MKNHIFTASLVAAMIASGAHAAGELSQTVQPQTTIEVSQQEAVAPQTQETQKTFVQSTKDLGNSALETIRTHKGKIIGTSVIATIIAGECKYGYIRSIYTLGRLIFSRIPRI